MKFTHSRKLIKEILDKNLYMTIATSNKSSLPWISNLFFAYDDDFNLYWYSGKNTKHSKLININKNVAISIFNSTLTGNEVYGIYIKAKAREITSLKLIQKALTLYSTKMEAHELFTDKKEKQSFESRIQDFRDKSALRIYAAKPSTIWLLGPSRIYMGKYLDKKIKISK